ncbi:MAG: class II fructose-bisphosphatase [Actinomycetes bacterium]|jgi:fructose-1,6-bisphosphatase class II|nr:class II fructose-bisphosphatase [Actinomycetes bacterium]
MEAARIQEMMDVTIAAAFAAGKWVGRGDKNTADGAAVAAMREALNQLPISGRVVIGEGERDEAPMLFIGEEVGSGGEAIDIAVDPIEGTNMTAYNQPNSIAVLAFAPRGSLLYAPDTYMHKIAAGPAARDVIDIDATPGDNCRAVAAALDKPVEDVVVCFLDRERNEEKIAAVREAGARVRLIGDGDVFGVISTAIAGAGIDLYLGSGAAPEGVLAATAMRCIDGGFQGRFLFRNDDERRRAEKTAGLDIDGVLRRDDLVRTDDAVFIATGITDGELLRGVGSGDRANSLVMDCKSKTIRFVETIYRGRSTGALSVA